MVDLKNVIVLFLAATLAGDAQWLNYPARGTPRTKEGKPNLLARVPRLAGKPDLSGVWQVEPAAKGDIERLLGDVAVDLVPGDDIHQFSKYYFNILDDFKLQEAPLRPEATAVMRNRPKGAKAPNLACLPIGVPRAELTAFPFKIVQTPGLIVMMYEPDHTHRQVYTDGRNLPVDPNPTWLGYSVGHWESETLVVDSAGFNDRVWIDSFGHPTSESLHIQERFRRRDFGHMDLQITIDDPKMYTKPFTIKVTQLLLPDNDILESFCAENEKDRAHMNQ